MSKWPRTGDWYAGCSHLGEEAAAGDGYARGAMHAMFEVKPTITIIGIKNEAFEEMETAFLMVCDECRAAMVRDGCIKGIGVCPIGFQMMQANMVIVGGDDGILN